MPVLPDVASTIVVRPGSMRPSRSAASTIAMPIRSLTEPPGLYISSLANSCAPASGARRLSWTIGVRPTCAAMLIGIADIGRSSLPAAVVRPRRGRGRARRSGDQGAEAGLRGLLAGLALDGHGLRRAHEVARVRGDLLGLSAQPVRAVEHGAAAGARVDDEAGDPLALLQRIQDVGDVLRVSVSGVGAVVHGLARVGCSLDYPGNSPPTRSET